jgi:hypothetical protein
MGLEEANTKSPSSQSTVIMLDKIRKKVKRSPPTP